VLSFDRDGVNEIVHERPHHPAPLPSPAGGEGVIIDKVAYLLSPSWERIEVRGRLDVFIQFPKNGRQDRIRHCQNIVVPETQDPVSLILQPFASGIVILRLFDMLSAIYLDDQLPFSADKINDIFSDRLLPSKLKGFCLPHAQPFPQEPLGIGRMPA
jgi:hypothetical protein